MTEPHEPAQLHGDLLHDCAAGAPGANETAFQMGFSPAAVGTLNKVLAEQMRSEYAHKRPEMVRRLIGEPVGVVLVTAKIKQPKLSLSASVLPKAILEASPALQPISGVWDPLTFGRFPLQRPLHLSADEAWALECALPSNETIAFTTGLGPDHFFRDEKSYTARWDRRAVIELLASARDGASWMERWEFALKLSHHAALDALAREAWPTSFRPPANVLKPFLLGDQDERVRARRVSRRLATPVRVR